MRVLRWRQGCFLLRPRSRAYIAALRSISAFDPHDTDNQDGGRGVISRIQRHPWYEIPNGDLHGAESGGSLDPDVLHPASHLYDVQ
jgi:hypothetical protein